MDEATQRSVHAFIICWSGKEQNALDIASAVEPNVEQLTTIYSNHTDNDFSGAGMWIKVPDEEFYGRKFARCIQQFDGDIFLLIHADVSCDNWKALIDNCCMSFDPGASVGYWSPEIDGTWFSLENCLIRMPVNRSSLAIVAQNDGIVWAVPSVIIEDLKTLDYSKNNLGWGVDWASLGFCYARGMVAVRDLAVLVHHPLERGYSKEVAVEQMREFLSQMGWRQRLWIAVLNRYVWLRLKSSQLPLGRCLGSFATRAFGLFFLLVGFPQRFVNRLIDFRSKQ